MKKIRNMIILVLVVSFLAACGGSNGNNDREPGETTPDDPGFTDPIDYGPSPYDFQETLMDLEGRVITMLTVGGRNFWDYDREDIDRTPNETLRQIEILRQIGEDYNAEIELYFHAASGLTAMLISERTAGNAPFDLFEAKMADFTMNTLWANNLVIPVTHPSISHVIMPYENPWRTSDFTTIGEVQWAVSFQPQNSNYVLEDVIVFNETLRQRFGLPNLYQMVRDGEWTWQNFENILQDIVNASNGTVFPLIYSHEMNITPMMVGSNNGRIAENTADGLRFVGDINEPALAAMHLIQSFGERGWFHPYVPTHNHSSLGHVGTALANGEAFFGFSWYSMIKNLTRQAPGYEGEYTFGIIPAPIGPNNTTGHTTVVHNELLYYVMSEIERPYQAAAILVAMANRAGQRTYRVLQHEARYSLQSDASVEMLEMMLNNITIDVSRIHGASRTAAGTGIVGAGLRILRSDTTPVVAMQEIQGTMQGWFDDLNAIVYVD